MRLHPVHRLLHYESGEASIHDYQPHTHEIQFQRYQEELCHNVSSYI